MTQGEPGRGAWHGAGAATSGPGTRCHGRQEQVLIKGRFQVGMQENASFKDKQMNKKKSDPGGLVFWRLVSEVTEMWWAKIAERKGVGNHLQGTRKQRWEVGKDN